MIDTNVLFSAIVFKSRKINETIEKIVDELYRVVRRKKSELEYAIDKFLSKLSFEHVFSPKVIEGERLFTIRDENDYVILHTAIIESIDVLITGDKDLPT